jgi:hypothetical protein
MLRFFHNPVRYSRTPASAFRLRLRPLGGGVSGTSRARRYRSLAAFLASGRGRPSVVPAVESQEISLTSELPLGDRWRIGMVEWESWLWNWEFGSESDLPNVNPSSMSFLSRLKNRRNFAFPFALKTAENSQAIHGYTLAFSLFGG